jgi:hypothetical protein
MANVDRNISMCGLNGLDGDPAVYCTTRAGKTLFVRGERQRMNIVRTMPRSDLISPTVQGFVAQQTPGFVDREQRFVGLKFLLDWNSREAGFQ